VRIRANPSETLAPQYLAHIKVSEPGNFSSISDTDI
jgi:hypothetical protein